jgi:hypothetical protein
MQDNVSSLDRIPAVSVTCVCKLLYAVLTNTSSFHCSHTSRQNGCSLTLYDILVQGGLVASPSEQVPVRSIVAIALQRWRCVELAEVEARAPIGMNSYKWVNCRLNLPFLFLSCFNFLITPDLGS